MCENKVESSCLAKKETQVAREHQVTMKEVANLERLIGTLNERFSAVLRRDIPVEKETRDEIPKPSLVPLAETFRSLTSTLSFCNQALTRIIDAREL